MSMSHNYNLPLIKMHQFAWGVESAWVEVECLPSPGVKEIVDVFSMVDCFNSGLWQNELGHNVKLYPGMTIVSEYKETKSDLRADRSKPHRKPGALAMGDFRFYWIRRDGPIEVHDIDEGNGWGVIVFDDVTFDIARPPLRQGTMAKWETAKVIRELTKSEMYESIRQVKDAAAHTLSGPASPSSLKPKTTSAPRSETIRDTDGYKDVHAHAAEKYIEEGPTNTAGLKRHLEHETGWSGTPRKLHDHLKKHSKKLVPPPPGGLWMIKG